MSAVLQKKLPVFDENWVGHRKTETGKQMDAFVSLGNLGLVFVKGPTAGIKTHENLPHKLMPQSCTTVGQLSVQDTSKSAVTWQINHVNL